MNMKWTWYGRYPWDKLINLDELGFDEISGFSSLLKPFRHSTNLGCTRGELLPLGVWRHKQLWFVNGSPSCMLKLLCSAMLWRFQPKGKASKLLVIVRKVQCLHDDVCDGLCWDSIWHRCGQHLFPSDSTVILVPILFLWAENGYLQWNLQVPGALAGPDHAASLNTAANSSVTMNVQTARLDLDFRVSMQLCVSHSVFLFLAGYAKFAIWLLGVLFHLAGCIKLWAAGRNEVMQSVASGFGGVKVRNSVSDFQEHFGLLVSCQSILVKNFRNFQDNHSPP